MHESKERALFSKERNVLLGFISRKQFEKKNVAFFKITQNNDAFRMQKNAVPHPV